MALWSYNPFDISQHPEDDLLVPFLPREFRNLLNYSTGRLRPFLQDTGASVNFDKDKFQANIDVQQFNPEEITVKTSGNEITVEGKHEEKRDEHGLISRHFVRRYVLPEGHNIQGVESKLSSDGVLTVTAPKIETGKVGQRNIPVIQTGQPSKALEQKANKKEE